jgi:DNA-directed RNA polymerase II subunit RPB11
LSIHVVTQATLTSQLLQTPNVLFAGYKVPHPLHPYFLLKIQTDGTQTPQEALENVCTSLIATIGDLESKFKMEFQVKSVDMAGGVAAPSGTEDPYLGSGWNAGGGYADY